MSTYKYLRKENDNIEIRKLEDIAILAKKLNMTEDELQEYVLNRAPGIPYFKNIDFSDSSRWEVFSTEDLFHNFTILNDEELQIEILLLRRFNEDQLTQLEIKSASLKVYHTIKLLKEVIGNSNLIGLDEKPSKEQFQRDINLYGNCDSNKERENFLS